MSTSVVRAKFRCTSKTEHDGGTVEYRFAPVMAKYVKDASGLTKPDPAHENSKLWAASPNGEFRIAVDKRFTSAAWEVGQHYYLDTSPAPND